MFSRPPRDSTWSTVGPDVGASPVRQRRDGPPDADGTSQAGRPTLLAERERRLVAGLSPGYVPGTSRLQRRPFEAHRRSYADGRC